MLPQEENDENELPRLLEQIDSVEAGRYALERMAAITLQHAQEAARNRSLLQQTNAQLKEVIECYDAIILRKLFFFAEDFFRTLF